MSVSVRLHQYRWLWFGHQRLGRRGRASLSQVSPQQPHSGPDTRAGTLPPVAREALRGRADPWAVQDVHAVQGHERGLPRAAGDAGLQARDRGSPSQTETEDRQQKNMNSPGQVGGDVSVFSFCNYQTSGCNKEKISIKGKKRIWLISKKLERASNFCLLGFYAAGIKIPHFPCREPQTPPMQCLTKVEWLWDSKPNGRKVLLCLQQSEICCFLRSLKCSWKKASYIEGSLEWKASQFLLIRVIT